MTIKDTGQRQTYETGAAREPRGQGKGRFDLIPWYCMQRLAQHYEAGARKYAERNWEKGLPLSSYADSAMRHFAQFLMGDRSEDHLAAVLWNACGLMWTEEEIRCGRLPMTLNDVPNIQIGSIPAAVEAIDRMRQRTQGQLIDQTGAHAPQSDVGTPARLDVREDTDQGYSEECKQAVRLLLGTWADHPPYTDLAELYMTDREKFDTLEAEHVKEAKPARNATAEELENASG